MSIVIRPATISDSDAIAELFRHTRKTSLPFLPILHSAQEDRDFVRKKLFSDCEIWVAEETNIFGFIAFREDWIDHLYIHPGHQRRGIGRALCEIAQSKYSRLSLWLFTKNSNAAKFYESLGFAKIEETDGMGNEEKEPDALYRWTQ